MSVDPHPPISRFLRLRTPALVAAMLLTAAAAVAQPTGPNESGAERSGARQWGVERYQLVKIILPTSSQLDLLRRTDSDHIRKVEGGYEAALAEHDVAELRREGVNLVVVVEDLERYYSDRAAADIARMRRETPELLERPVPAVPDFRFGSAAGYYTLEEVTRELARMSARFPGLVGAPFPIGRSVEGREILAARISARPESEGVPEVLFTALQHSREPIGMMSLLYSAWALLDGYGTDPEATYLLDHRALYLVPVVNPDGYQLNLERFPRGGGLWRKNRGSGGGVDLNRNYGPPEFWDDRNRGSSDRAGDLTYRGPEPFSEPETRAIRDFCGSRSFRIALNLHSFSNLLIYPFDFEGRVPADSAFFRLASREMALDNGFAPGVGRVGVGYPSRGIADEWMYVEGRAGDRIMSWAPELGSEEDGFWPRITRIPDMVVENHRMNLTALWIAGAAPAITDVQRVESGGRAALRVTITNIGRDSMTTEGTIAIAGGASDGRVVVPPLASLAEATLLLPVPELRAAGARPALPLVLTYGGASRTRVVRPLLDADTVLFADDFEGSLGAWRAGEWRQEEVEGRGKVLSDSPGRDYRESELPNIIQTRAPISLEGMAAAELLFDARWVVDAKDHDARVEVRRAGDSLWESVDGEYLQVAYDTSDGKRSHFRGDAREWHRYAIPLDSFTGDRIQLRFLIHTPRGPFHTTFDGVMIDNLVIEGRRARLDRLLVPERGDPPAGDGDSHSSQAPSSPPDTTR